MKNKTIEKIEVELENGRINFIHYSKKLIEDLENLLTLCHDGMLNPDDFQKNVDLLESIFLWILEDGDIQKDLEEFLKDSYSEMILANRKDLIFLEEKQDNDDSFDFFEDQEIKVKVVYKNTKPGTVHYAEQK